MDNKPSPTKKSRILESLESFVKILINAFEKKEEEGRHIDDNKVGNLSSQVKYNFPFFYTIVGT